MKERKRRKRKRAVHGLAGDVAEVKDISEGEAVGLEAAGIGGSPSSSKLTNISSERRASGTAAGAGVEAVRLPIRSSGKLGSSVCAAPPPAPVTEGESLDGDRGSSP